MDNEMNPVSFTLVETPTMNLKGGESENSAEATSMQTYSDATPMQIYSGHSHVSGTLINSQSSIASTKWLVTSGDSSDSSERKRDLGSLAMFTMKQTRLNYMMN